MKLINHLNLAKLYFVLIFNFAVLTFANNVNAQQIQKTLSVAAVGDVMMGTSYPSSSLLPPQQGGTLWSQAKEYFSGHDIKFINFEGTFFDGAPQPDGKSPGPNKFLFRTPTQFVQNLVDAGVNMVSLANNHSRDFGQAGLNSTKNVLKEAGISFSGKSENEIAYFQNADFKVALVAVDYYTGVRSIRTRESTLNEIKKLKQQGLIVMVSAHVGAEGDNAIYTPQGDEIFLGENRGDSRQFAIEAIQSGADAIIMHGPHVPRGIELYKNKIIFYSLGNFMTGRGLLVSGRAGLAPMVSFNLNSKGDFISGKVISFQQSHNPHEIEVDSTQAAYNLMRRVSLKQFPYSQLKFSNNGEITVD